MEDLYPIAFSSDPEKNQYSPKGSRRQTRRHRTSSERYERDVVVETREQHSSPCNSHSSLEIHGYYNQQNVGELFKNPSLIGQQQQSTTRRRRRHQRRSGRRWRRRTGLLLLATVMLSVTVLGYLLVLAGVICWPGGEGEATGGGGDKDLAAAKLYELIDAHLTEACNEFKLARWAFATNMTDETRSKAVSSSSIFFFLVTLRSPIFGQSVIFGRPRSNPRSPIIGQCP
jgi:hypothetical protein